jgi:hypothetical protein
MEEKTKYIIIGLVIGVAVGAAVLYLLVASGIIRPFIFRDLGRAGNFTGNFTRTFRNVSGAP